MSTLETFLTKEEQDKLESLFGNLPEIIFILDREGKINFISRVVEGFDKNAVIGTHAYQYVPLEYRETLKNAYESVFNTGKSISFELCGMGPNNSESWYETSIGPIYHDGKIASVLCISKDITELKYIQQQKAKLEGQIRHSQKIEAISRLSGGVAHEFNNLLTVITGQCHLLLSQLPKENPLRRHVDEIAKSADQCAYFIRKILSFSGKEVSETRLMGLNAVVNSISYFLQRTIGENIKLIKELQDDLWPIKADSKQLEQVIINIVLNSYEAMPSGGTITIKTANVETPTHHEIERGSYVSLIISDTGVGMDNETLSHLFEPFFTTKDKGAGLGLFTTFSIVKRFGGHIFFESKPQNGTTFTIYFPRTEVPPEIPKPESPSLTKGSETILLVEDEKPVRDLATEILKLYGYMVLPTRDVTEAIDICNNAEEQIHLLLTDVVMPRMNGRELFEKIKPLRPKIKVIFMSGYTDDEVIRYGLLGSATNFLQKPFSPETLARKVREVLDTQV